MTIFADASKHLVRCALLKGFEVVFSYSLQKLFLDIVIGAK